LTMMPAYGVNTQLHGKRMPPPATAAWQVPPKGPPCSCGTAGATQGLAMQLWHGTQAKGGPHPTHTPCSLSTRGPPRLAQGAGCAGLPRHALPRPLLLLLRWQWLLRRLPVDGRPLPPPSRGCGLGGGAGTGGLQGADVAHAGADCLRSSLIRTARCFSSPLCSGSSPGCRARSPVTPRTRPSRPWRPVSGRMQAPHFVVGIQRACGRALAYSRVRGGGEGAGVCCPRWWRLCAASTPRTLFLLQWRCLLVYPRSACCCSVDAACMA
jgi:hypothetical protein